MTVNQEIKITNKSSDLVIKKNIPFLSFNKFRKKDNTSSKDIPEINEKEDDLRGRTALQENHKRMAKSKNFLKRNQDIKEKTINGFFLTNLNSISSKSKNLEIRKNNFLNDFLEDNKRDKFSTLHIDSRSKRSLFFSDLIEKNKAENIEKTLNLIKNKNNDSNTLKKVEKSSILLIRRENKHIIDGIKKRNGSLKGITTFLTGSNSRNSINFNEVNNKKYTEKISTNSTNPKLHTFYNSSPKKIPTINKNSDAESSNNSSITKSQDMNRNENNPKSKTHTNGFKQPSQHKKLNKKFVPTIDKIINEKIEENLKKVLINTANIKHELNDLYSLEQNTIGMRFDLIRSQESNSIKHNYEYLNEQKMKIPRNLVKGIYNIDAKEMVYIDENKANILNHIDTISRMRNENFYKFRKVCVEKYNYYSRKNDIFEYVFGNERYVPKGSFKTIDDNTFKLRKMFVNMKNTRTNIKKFFDEKKNEKKRKE